MRDYRLEICCRETDGSFRTLYAHQFRSPDVREARTKADVWVAGNAGVVLHYDGQTWSRVKIAGLGARRPDLFALWSPAPGRIWVGGYGIVLALGGKP